MSKYTERLKQDAVKVTGPLSALYAKALNDAFSKANETDQGEVDLGPGTGLESMAAMMKRDESGDFAGEVTAHCISGGDIGPDTVIDVMRGLGASEPGFFLLIREDKEPKHWSDAASQKSYDVMYQRKMALESLVDAMGGTIAHVPFDLITADSAGQTDLDLAPAKPVVSNAITATPQPPVQNLNPGSSVSFEGSAYSRRRSYDLP